MTISHDRLLNLLQYDPETGIFRWRKSRGGALAGSIAGCQNKKGYWVIRVDRVLYLGHRLAWFYVKGYWPLEQVDHEHLTKANNRFAGLRPASNSENQANQTVDKSSSTGLKGVSFDRSRGKFEAYIGYCGRKIHLGRYNNSKSAHEAYVSKAKELYGDFSRAN